MEKTTTRYGVKWNPGVTDLDIEMECIRRGGEWKAKNGKTCGAGLFQHYRQMQSIIWPKEDHNRWSDLILSEILGNTITVLSGSGDTGKTHGMAKYALCDYWCFPEETLFIISSTDMRSLDMRIWGDIKGMFADAKKRFPHLPGVVLDAKHAISTDDLEDEDTEARDLRRGLIGIPCKKSSGGETNIASYVGIKQKRRRMLADEFQFMTHSMYESLANLNAGDFKLVAAGNPIGQGDPLDLISEPEGGWESVDTSKITKTTVWKNRVFLNSRTVNLVGVDSPNFDPPWKPGDKPRYWYLINEDKIKRIESAWSKDSSKYWSQCMGLRVSGLLSKRVLTREICEQGRAFEEVVWSGKPTKKVFALDAAYGGVGGDRCVGGHVEWGESAEGKVVVAFSRPVLVPVSVRNAEPPEDQIATWVKNYCQTHGIEASSVFYDSTGRGSLGISLARIWSAACNPVEFGGRPSERPVTQDALIFDPRLNRRRLQLCSEHYSKFVTELWYSVRYAVQSGQIRQFPKDVAAEFYLREWREVAGAKIEVETKDEMKERIGKSPDLADWAACAMEGCRRSGFKISRFAEENAESGANFQWLRDIRDKNRRLIQAHELKEA